MNSETYNQKIQSVIQEKDGIISEQIEEMRKNYEEGRDLLFQTEINPKALQTDDKIGYFSLLLNFCNNACLFADEDIMKKLESHGISDKVTRWFIPRGEIDKELNVIEKKNMLIFKNLALYNIRLFLSSKIRAALYKEAIYILDLKPELDADLKQSVKLMYRRREDSNGEPKRTLTPFEREINDQVKFFEELYGQRKKAKLAHIKLIEGKSETLMLNALLHNFIPKDKMEQTTFLSSIAGIFRLISKERIIWSEEEFEDRESTYENNYNRYLAIQVKILTGFRPGKDDLRNILVHSQ